MNSDKGYEWWNWEMASSSDASCCLNSTATANGYCIDCGEEAEYEYVGFTPPPNRCLKCGGHNVGPLDNISRHLLDRLGEVEKLLGQVAIELVILEHKEAWEELAK